MFIKLVANPSASNSATAWKEWTETIGNILDGTWTSTSSLSTTYFNQGACQIIGSKPTTNDGTDSFTEHQQQEPIPATAATIIFNLNLTMLKDQQVIVIVAITNCG